MRLKKGFLDSVAVEVGGEVIGGDLMVVSSAGVEMLGRGGAAGGMEGAGGGEDTGSAARGSS